MAKYFSAQRFGALAAPAAAALAQPKQSAQYWGCAPCGYAWNFMGRKICYVCSKKRTNKEEGIATPLGRWRKGATKPGSTAVPSKEATEVEKALLIFQALHKGKGEDHPTTIEAKHELDAARARRDSARPPRSAEPKQARLTLGAREKELTVAKEELQALIAQRGEVLCRIAEAEKGVAAKEEEVAAAQLAAAAARTSGAAANAARLLGQLRSLLHATSGESLALADAEGPIADMQVDPTPPGPDGQRTPPKRARTEGAAIDPLRRALEAAEAAIAALGAVPAAIAPKAEMAEFPVLAVQPKPSVSSSVAARCRAAFDEAEISDELEMAEEDVSGLFDAFKQLCAKHAAAPADQGSTPGGAGAPGGGLDVVVSLAPGDGAAADSGAALPPLVSEPTLGDFRAFAKVISKKLTASGRPAPYAGGAHDDL